jgi:hypothetical protein
LREHAAVAVGATAPTYETDGINVDGERCSAALNGRLGIDDVRFAKREIEALRARRVLVE